MVLEDGVLEDASSPTSVEENVQAGAVYSLHSRWHLSTAAKQEEEEAK